jgi:hypothetical protein
MRGKDGRRINEMRTMGGGGGGSLLPLLPVIVVSDPPHELNPPMEEHL